MFLYIVLDLQQKSWTQLSNSEELYNNILVLINTFLRMSYDNKVVVVNDRKHKIYDHDHPVLIKRDNIIVTDIFNYNNVDNLANDIGYTLVLSRDMHNCKIIVVSLSKENKNDYLKYLKIAFIAKRYRNKHSIYVFSYYRNPALSEIGYYHDNFSLSTFIQLLCATKPKKLFFSSTKCICHEKEIVYGLVCPICLSIYCRFVPVCKKCRIKFNFNHK